MVIDPQLNWSYLSISKISQHLHIRVISLVTKCATKYLAFVVLLIVQSYFHEAHAIGPPLSISRKLDWDFQSFKSMAKFASHYECQTWFLLLPLYVILIKAMRYKYFMMRFNVAICCICGFLVNLVSCVTANEMSEVCKLQAPNNLFVREKNWFSMLPFPMCKLKVNTLLGPIGTITGLQFSYPYFFNLEIMYQVWSMWITRSFLIQMICNSTYTSGYPIVIWKHHPWRTKCVQWNPPWHCMPYHHPQKWLR